jgi:hypothetical protein
MRHLDAAETISSESIARLAGEAPTIVLKAQI